MGKTIFFYFFILLSCSKALFAQNDYQMQPGEVILVDPAGKILNSSLPPKSKYNPELNSPSVSSKISDYNDDGSLKIPGYTPTGNAEVDAQNYKKAKLLFYQNRPEEYKKWQEKLNSAPHPGHKQEINAKEFDRMPKNKQQHIRSNPEKYRIVKNQ